MFLKNKKSLMYSFDYICMFCWIGFESEIGMKCVAIHE